MGISFGIFCGDFFFALILLACLIGRGSMGRRRVLDLAGWVPITSPELILKFERFLWKGRGAGLAFWVFIALVVSRFAVWALLLALSKFAFDL